MTYQDITIRPFDAATDTETLCNIWLDASLAAHSFIGRQRLIEQRALIREVYLPMAETWLVSRDGNTAGFISLVGNAIGGLFIAPDQQGAGLGRRLVDHAKTLRPTLTLEVYTQNRDAMQFYAAQGFRETSRRAVDDQGLPFENARMVFSG